MYPASSHASHGFVTLQNRQQTYRSVAHHRQIGNPRKRTDRANVVEGMTAGYLETKQGRDVLQSTLPYHQLVVTFFGQIPFLEDCSFRRVLVVGSAQTVPCRRKPEAMVVSIVYLQSKTRNGQIQQRVSPCANNSEESMGYIHSRGHSISRGGNTARNDKHY